MVSSKQPLLLRSQVRLLQNNVKKAFELLEFDDFWLYAVESVQERQMAFVVLNTIIFSGIKDICTSDRLDSFIFIVASDGNGVPTHIHIICAESDDMIQRHNE